MEIMSEAKSYIDKLSTLTEWDDMLAHSNEMIQYLCFAKDHIFSDKEELSHSKIDIS